MLFRQKGTGTAQHLTTPNLRDLWQGRVIAVGIQVLNAGQIQTLLDRRHRSAYVCWLTWTVAAWSFNMAIKQNVLIHGFFSCQTAFRCFYAVLNPHWSCACVWIVHNGGCGGVQFRICTKKPLFKPGWFGSFQKHSFSFLAFCAYIVYLYLYACSIIMLFSMYLYAKWPHLVLSTGSFSTVIGVAERLGLTLSKIIHSLPSTLDIGVWRICWKCMYLSIYTCRLKNLFFECFLYMVVGGMRTVVEAPLKLKQKSSIGETAGHTDTCFWVSSRYG